MTSTNNNQKHRYKNPKIFTGDEKAQNVRQLTDCCRRANVTANTSLISYLTNWERLLHTNKDT